MSEGDSRFGWLKALFENGQANVPHDNEDRDSLPQLKEIVQDANLNFLFGAGTSSALCSLLGNVEEVLTDLPTTDLSEGELQFAVASVYGSYLDSALVPNLQLLKGGIEALEVVDAYTNFLKTLHSLLIERGDTLLDRQVNLFTTNMDLAIEAASEVCGVELNDGFDGRLLARFSPSRFGQVRLRKTMFHERTSEVPVFNLLKLHGSVAWRQESDQNGRYLAFDSELKVLREAIAALDPIKGELLEIKGDENAEAIALRVRAHDDTLPNVAEFLSAYEQLQIVNPTKQKFHETVFGQNYYDLMRTFANVLEKPNSALFVCGFSFRDEHLREIVRRAALTNPSLLVVVFGYSSEDVAALEKFLQPTEAVNRNIRIVEPSKSDSGETNLDLTEITQRFFGKTLDTVWR